MDAQLLLALPADLPRAALGLCCWQREGPLDTTVHLPELPGGYHLP